MNKKALWKKICLVHALNFYVRKSATSFFCPQVILNICLMNKLCPNAYFVLQNDHSWRKSNKNEFVNFFRILTGLRIPSPLTRGGLTIINFWEQPGGAEYFCLEVERCNFIRFRVEIDACSWFWLQLWWQFCIILLIADEIVALICVQYLDENMVNFS